jgi:small-conductance mechanosensitive channel
MDALMDGFTQDWNTLIGMAPRILLATFVCLAFYWIGRLAGRGVAGVMRKSSITRTHLAFFRRLTVVVFTVFGLLLALNLIGLRSVSASLLAGGGISAVVLGFAFREIGENFLAGLLLAFNRPFEVGHLIESGGFQGTVRGIALRHTHIRSADGRDIFIPSAQILKVPLVNFTKDGLRRFSLAVAIDYRDDPAAARELLLEKVRGTDGVLDRIEPAVVVTALGSRTVELEAFYWVDTFTPGIDVGRIRSDLVGGCREALLSAGFTLTSDVARRVELTPTDANSSAQ